jgi:hypothetical protein
MRRLERVGQLLIMLLLVLFTLGARTDPVWRGLSWATLGSYWQSNDQYRQFLWWVFVVLHIATGFVALMVAVYIYEFIDRRFRPSTSVTNLFYGGSGLAAIYIGYYATGPIFIALYGIVCVLGSIHERKGT